MSSATSSQKSINLINDLRVINIEVPLSHKLFPYISLLQRKCNIPRFFHHLTFILFLLQACGVSSWIIYQDEESDFQYYLSLCLLFTPTREASYKPVIISFFVGTIILMLMLIIPMIIFIRSQRVFYWILPIQNVIISIISPVLSVPLFSQFGIGIATSYVAKETELYIYLIFTGIACILNSLVLYLSFCFSANTVFFLDSHYLLAHHRLFTFIALCQSILSMFSFVMMVIGDSMIIADIVLHIVFALISCFCGFMAPFMFNWVNYILSGISIGSLIGDILSFFVDDLKWRLVAIIVFSVVFSIIFKFIFGMTAKRIMKTHKQFFASIKIQLSLTYSGESFLSGEIFDEIIKEDHFELTNSLCLQIAKYTCFFPEFQSIFTTQIALLRTATDLNLGDAFLLYQLRCAEIGRQPLSAIEEVQTLRKESLDLSNTERALWSQINPNISFSSFEKLSQTISLVRNHWIETISKYPRNALVAENYSHYLLECECDFEKAAEWHYRALKLQSGYAFDYDSAAIHFLHHFPQYYKKLIMGQSMASIDDLDNKKTEELLENMIKQPKLRIQFHKVLSNVNSIWENLLLLIIVLRFVGFLVYWIVMVSLFTKKFESRDRNLEFIYNTSLIGEAVATSNIAINLQKGKELGSIIDSVLVKKIIGENRKDDNQYLIDLSMDLFDAAFEYINMGLDCMDSFVNMLNYQSSQDIDMHLVIETISLTNLNISFYANIGTELAPIIIQSDIEQAGFRETVTFYLCVAEMATKSPRPYEMFNDWVSGIFINEISVTCPQILDYIKVASQSIMENDSKDVDHDLQYHMIIAIIVIVVCIIFFIIFYIVIYSLARYDTKKTIKLCCQFNQSTIHHASSTMSINEGTTYGSNFNFVSIDRSGYTSITLFVFDILLTCVMILSVFLFYYYVRSNHNQFTSINELLLQSSMRCIYSLKIFVDFLRMNLGDCYCSSLDIPVEDTELSKTISDFASAHEACLRGDYGSGDVGKEINSIRKYSVCPSSWENLTYYEQIACMPLDSCVSNFLDLVRELKNKQCDCNVIIESSFITPFVLVNEHLYFMMKNVSQLLLQYGEETSRNFDSSILIICIVVLIILVIVSLISLVNLYLINQTNKAMNIFILRLPPVDAVAHGEFMSKFIGKKATKKLSKMSISEKVVSESKYPVLILNKEKTIENVNPAFLLVFGYDLSQIIGQSPEHLIEDQDITKVLEKSNDPQRCPVAIKKENKSYLNCEIVLLPIPLTDEEDSQKNYAIIIIDMSNILSKIKTCKELKDKNDTFIERIIPSILTENNSLYLEIGVVLYLKLVLYGGNLTPGIYFNQRKTIFSFFDKLLENHPTLHRITINNGEYIVVGKPDCPSLIADVAKEAFLFSIELTDLFEDPAFMGDYVAGIETGPISLHLINNDRIHIFANSIAVRSAKQLMRISKNGEIAMSEKVYRNVATIEAPFIKKKNNLVGTYYIVSAEVNSDAMDEGMSGFPE
ncbi:hypothetical protein TRFO_03859 [Tritrichomonas foetus]|uniref:PAS domain-containing protein n=1 Tax=Tritrichomonas foetus TaxID=1144522 RepID=A0A1J4KPM1_9EUKA|nr:hypothetical protein TRFO_03859 [Tritrichomonas foetus]|eukprot:OHT11654.1 hypothetical protein TRFO_03859 [Tritrichomonas foetus]